MADEMGVTPPSSSRSARSCSAPARCRCSTWPPATPPSPTRAWPRRPIVVTRVEFPDGTVEELRARGEAGAHRRSQAGRVTYALQQVIDGGTGEAAAFGRPAAGKTGTTQNNNDAWFVGYTPKLTAAVWMGYPDGLKPDGRRARHQGAGRHLPGGDLAEVHGGGHRRLRHRRLPGVRPRGARRRRDARPQLRHVGHHRVGRRRSSGGRPRPPQPQTTQTTQPQPQTTHAADHGTGHHGAAHHRAAHHRPPTTAPATTAPATGGRRRTAPGPARAPNGAGGP